MSKTIVNLTLPAVIKAIEDVLETYPHHPYQQAFSVPDLRQELIAYVMSRVSNCYVVVDEGQQPSINFNSLPGFRKGISSIEALIHKGMEKVLKKRAATVNHQIPEEVNPDFAPSNWFG
jgi:hypothetical protein